MSHLPEVVAYVQAHETLSRGECALHALPWEYEQLRKLRLAAVEALRKLHRRGVSASFCRRYSQLVQDTTVFKTRAYREARAASARDLREGFPRAVQRARLSALLGGASDAEATAAADAELASLTSEWARVRAASEAWSAAVSAMPDLGTEDEWVSVCADAKRLRAKRTREAFEASQREYEEGVRAQKKARLQARAAERRAALRARRLGLLRDEERWVLGPACARAERVLTNYVHAMLGMGVSLSGMMSATAVSATLSHAFSAWCETMASVSHVDMARKQADVVFAQLWETVTLESVRREGDTAVVVGSVDGSLSTTVRVPWVHPHKIKPEGFVGALRERRWGLPRHGRVPLSSATFPGAAAVASVLCEMTPRPPSKSPLYDAYTTWHARIVRAKTLPWHLLKPAKPAKPVKPAKPAVPMV